MSGGLDLDELDRMFFAECEDYLRSAEAVLAMEDGAPQGVDGIDLLRRCVHSIKGASLTLGFSGLGALATVLECCLATAREGSCRPNWVLFREGFAAIRDNLAGLRAGGSKSLGAHSDLLRRLEAMHAASEPVVRTMSFRLSATGAATPVLFDDMLADLRKEAEVSVLQWPWDGLRRECRIEACSVLADRVLIGIIERVAEPGSVRIVGEERESTLMIGAPVVAMASASAPVLGPTACVAFSLGARKFAADAPGIEEIRIGGAIHAAVTASAWVCGTIERDGVLVPVIDLQRCLDLGGSEIRTSSMQLISRVAGETVAVLVDDVEDVLSLEPGAVRPFSRMIARDLPRGVLGVLNRNGELLWVLDLPRVLAACIEADDAP